jgi:hypothetical protein
LSRGPGDLQRFILAELEDRATLAWTFADDDEAWAGAVDLAARRGTNVRNVKRALRSLEASGAVRLRRERRSGRHEACA